MPKHSNRAHTCFHTNDALHVLIVCICFTRFYSCVVKAFHKVGHWCYKLSLSHLAHTSKYLSKKIFLYHPVSMRDVLYLNSFLYVCVCACLIKLHSYYLEMIILR